MEAIDSLKTADEVKVTIWGPDGSTLYESTNSGYHSLERAIREAIDNANLEINPEDCVFGVNNETTGVSHRYRLNAHGNIKLIL